MIERPIQFPTDFVFGSATAAHQVEGGNVHNDWWAHEHAADTNAIEPSGIACDHYHRFADDFRLLQLLGHRAHRLSIEWARIEPEEGLFAGLEECFTDFSNMETKMATIIEDDFKIPFAEEFLELAKENAKLNLMKNGLVDESGKLLACMQKYKV